MADYTAKLNLAKPDYGDPVNVDVLNGNAKKIDKYANFVVGVPADIAGAPTGQLFYNQNLFRYQLKNPDGTFTDLGTMGKARGKIAQTIVTANSANIVNSEIVTALTATFTAEVGRRYLIIDTHNIRWVSGSDGTQALNMTAHYRWAPGATITTSSTEIGLKLNNVCDAVGSDKQFTHFVEFFPNINGQVTVGVTLQNTNTVRTGQLFAALGGRNATFTVKDYGN